MCVHPDSKLRVLARHVLREIIETIAAGGRGTHTDSAANKAGQSVCGEDITEDAQ